VILGFDFGLKYIGVAVGQNISGTASPLKTLTAKDGIPHWPALLALVNQWQPEQLIVGLPLNMDGSMQLLSYCARKFGRRLAQHTRLPVAYVDERLSTWEAKQRLLKSVKHDKTNLKQLNALAATILVERWLENTLHNTLGNI
jgi:putative Holliday junction resolvase